MHKTLLGVFAAAIIAGPISAPAAIIDIDVTGIDSVDALGDVDNEVRTLLLAPNASVTRVGWNVRLFADAPSWLSEMSVMIGNSAGKFVSLRPGTGDNSPGMLSYNSGGIVDLVGLGLDFNILADGILRLQFYETFDDYFDDFDGVWQSGTLSFRYEGRAIDVPEPGTLALLGLGLVGLAGTIRRRRT